LPQLPLDARLVTKTNINVFMVCNSLEILKILTDVTKISFFLVADEVFAYINTSLPPKPDR